MLEGVKTREFERAMAELQAGLWVVKTEERYEPTFSYRWDLLESWLPAAVAEGRRLSRPAALERVIERYLAAVVLAREGSLARLFRLRADEVAAAVRRLVAREVLVADAVVQGLAGRWLVHASARRTTR
jgi:hypothetical protein